MILVLGGTQEAREISVLLASEGYKVLVTVASGYGAGMMPKEAGAEVLVGRLDGPDLEHLITKRGIKMIVDVTHPYARDITETAWEIAKKTEAPYIRYERPAVSEVSESGTIYRVKTYQEAAKLTMSLGNTIFLAIGSKNIQPFVQEGRRLNKRVVVRVLPDATVLEQCYALGIRAQDILALQGPFSIELNLAMLRHYAAEVLVTKDSGSVGGTDTKIEAAARLGVPVVMVDRPIYQEIPVTGDVTSIIQQAKQVFKPDSQNSIEI